MHIRPPFRTFPSAHPHPPPFVAGHLALIAHHCHWHFPGPTRTRATAPPNPPIDDPDAVMSRHPWHPMPIFTTTPPFSMLSRDPFCFCLLGMGNPLGKRKTWSDGPHACVHPESRRGARTVSVRARMILKYEPSASFLSLIMLAAVDPLVFHALYPRIHFSFYDTTSTACYSLFQGSRLFVSFHYFLVPGNKRALQGGGPRYLRMTSGSHSERGPATTSSLGPFRAQ